MAQEKQFEEKVKKYLKEQGCWYIKYWGGGGYTKSGIPDVLVCLNGYFIAIELKAPHGKPSELQLYNLNEITKANGIGILLYPKDYEDFKKFVINVKKGCIPSDLYKTYSFLTDWWSIYDSMKER